MVLALLLTFARAQEVQCEVEPCAPIGRGTEVQTAWEQSLGKPLAERLRLISEPMLGADYVVDGIGEGEGRDPDPLVRFDSFGCLSFVEELLAWTYATSLEEVSAARNEIRYNGSVHFDNRRHFMVPQWIPDNIAAGRLVDVTHHYGETQVVQKTITTRNWMRWRGRWKYEFSPEQYPTGSFTLGLLSLDAAVAATKDFPDGTLLLVVRESRDSNPVWVTHLGMVLRHSKWDVRIRHATKMGGGVLRDDRLPWYFEHVRTFRRWPVQGILVLQPVELAMNSSQTGVQQPVQFPE